MKPISEMFDLHRAKSGLFVHYKKGDVAYVGNGLDNNAVVGLVTPLMTDKVFTFRGIAVSAFCEATVQIPPFVACGRAGNGLVVLEPRSPMPVRQMAYIAAFINLAVCWRFNWYRQVTADRIRGLLIPSQLPDDITFDVNGALPKTSPTAAKSWNLSLRPFTLGKIYDLVPGDFHSMAELPAGTTPIVSCGDANNGVSAYVSVIGKTYKNRLTIAFNGMNTLTAKYHPYEFAAKDDVAVCNPRAPLRLTTELFIQMMINRERWRYSYYRKCFTDKLRRFIVQLPAKKDALDEDTMQTVVQAAPYWDYIRIASLPSHVRVE
jgi:hypothetical protein